MVERFVGLDVSQRSTSICILDELRSRCFAVVCLDARQARAALALRPNKTDANDAEGLAQILRLGWHRSVHVKSYGAHRCPSSDALGQSGCWPNGGFGSPGLRG